MKSQLGKRLRRFSARAGLQFCSLIIRLLPLHLLYGFGEVIGRLGPLVAVRQRRIAQESLEIAFADTLDGKARQQLIRECFLNIAKGALEMLTIIVRPQDSRIRVRFEGRGHIEKALTKGKGVIALSAHFGNFPLMIAEFARQGWPTAMVVRRMRDEKMEEYFQAKRKLLGVEAIYSQPRRECIQRCLEVLSSGKVLFIQLDQNFGSGGVFVDFFDQKAATATGPVVFALRTGAPIVPLFIVRQKDNSHRIIIEPEFRLEEQADQHQTIVVNIARITKIIERYIRDYPQEWGWIHRRWKSRPAGSP